MPGSTPPWKRRSRKRGADLEPSDGSHGARDAVERGPDAVTGEGAPLETAGGGAPAPAGSGGLLARRAEGRLHAALGVVAERIVAVAPRIPVRDLDTLRRHFPGLGPEEIADRLVAGAARASAAVGAGVGAANMLPAPPAWAAGMATEITAVAAVELKLVAELHEVYGRRPPGDLRARSIAYVRVWSSEHGVDPTRPTTFRAVVDTGLKQQLRRQIKRRLIRNVPNMLPFMVGATVGAVVNRRDTRRFAEHIRTDLRRVRVPWEHLKELPPLDRHAEPLDLPETVHEDHEAPEAPGRDDPGPDGPRKD
ncbi:hypothetical protein [Streptomyces sp. CO7]